jgi:hypothetical protein
MLQSFLIFTANVLVVLFALLSVQMQLLRFAGKGLEDRDDERKKVHGGQ